MTKDREDEERRTTSLTTSRVTVDEQSVPERTTRRCFLHVIGASSLLGAIPSCSSSDAGPEAFGDVSAGNVSALSVGDLQAVSGAPAIIGRDAGGLYAMTSTCTHEGCDMLHDGSVGRDGVYCSCHGSRFDVNGNAVSGPAHGALTHFAVSVDMTGVITVHGGTSVSAATRTAIG